MALPFSRTPACPNSALPWQSGAADVPDYFWPLRVRVSHCGDLGYFSEGHSFQEETEGEQLARQIRLGLKCEATLLMEDTFLSNKFHIWVAGQLKSYRRSEERIVKYMTLFSFFYCVISVLIAIIFIVSRAEWLHVPILSSILGAKRVNGQILYFIFLVSVTTTVGMAYRRYDADNQKAREKYGTSREEILFVRKCHAWFFPLFASLMLYAVAFGA
ncbi:MAG: hypothetical protein EOR60_24190 [Mesorhizobium sp.]|nr:MAG: hypothetical protein EOR60_24190 [Mesorhizobium sp.]